MADFGRHYMDDTLSGVVKKLTQEQFTIGKVVDTNDPQQMGRVRAVCPAFGDDVLSPINEILWAIYVSPLGGMVNFGKRGPKENSVFGPTAYGMWTIPEIGSYVLVGCIDGDSNLRFYCGCIHPQYLTHSQPHGRFIWSDQNNAPELDGLPDGPLDSFEQPINPLYENLDSHFYKVERTLYYAEGTPDDPRRNMEWRSRGADRMAAAVTTGQIQHPKDGTGTAVSDHNWDGSSFSSTTIQEENGNTLTIKGPGYALDQQEPDSLYEDTNGVNYASTVHSWTTPGFHSLSMDDRHDNCRIRLRTTTGHQIIMDDTNERIYISTAQGETWIELDQAGNIDIYASGNISTHAGGDINFTTQKTFRVQAKSGIHLHSKNEMRLHAVEDFHLLANANIRQHAGANLYLQADSELSEIAGGSVFLNADGGSVEIKASTCANITSGADTNILSTSQIVGTAPQIFWNGPPADEASAAAPSGEKQSWWPSRVPEHEPWARVFMSLAADQPADNEHKLEFSYTDQMVGKGSTERGESYNRNKYWHR